jgi:hypothetical protein
MSFRHLATVEIQLVMRCCTAADLVSLACTCRVALAAAQSNFAWDACSLINAKLDSACLAGMQPLQRFAPIRLACMQQFADSVPVVTVRVRTLAAITRTLTIDQVRMLYKQPWCTNLTALELCERQEAASLAGIRTWVCLAACAFPRLTTLRLTFEGSICVNPLTYGAFAALTHLELVADSSFGPDAEFHADLPLLRELHATRFNVKHLCNVLMRAQNVQKLHVYGTASYTQRDWAALWQAAQCVTFLQISCVFLIEAIQELASDTTHMPHLEQVLVRLRMWDSHFFSGEAVQLVPCLKALFSTRPNVRVTVVIETGKYASTRVVEHTRFLDDLNALQMQFTTLLKVQAE